MFRRTITLTDSAPVTIVDDEWPIIASATEYDPYGDEDEYDTAGPSPTEWWMKIRQHKDGRAIVYAGYDAVRRGVLLPAGSDNSAIVVVVRAMAQDIVGAGNNYNAGIWSELAAKCIANMPAEVLA